MGLSESTVAATFDGRGFAGRDDQRGGLIFQSAVCDRYRSRLLMSVLGLGLLA